MFSFTAEAFLPTANLLSSKNNLDRFIWGLVEVLAGGSDLLKGLISPSSSTLNKHERALLPVGVSFCSEKARRNGGLKFLGDNLLELLATNVSDISLLKSVGRAFCSAGAFMSEKSMNSSSMERSDSVSKERNPEDPLKNLDPSLPKLAAYPESRELVSWSSRGRRRSWREQRDGDA